MLDVSESERSKAGYDLMGSSLCVAAVRVEGKDSGAKPPHAVVRTQNVAVPRPMRHKQTSVASVRDGEVLRLLLACRGQLARVSPGRRCEIGLRTVPVLTGRPDFDYRKVRYKW